MPKRSRTPRPTDPNQLAALIVSEAPGAPQKPVEPVSKLRHPEPKWEPKAEKNPAAVALGRLGGRKGGIARTAKLSPERRKEISALGAKARWKKKKPNG
jgi:hypothetical protein